MRNAGINTVLSLGLSPERLSKYLAATGNNLDDALSLYERNTRLAETFYTPLQVMEVCLRNKVNDQLTARYGSDWFRPGKAPLQNDAIDKVRDAISELNQASRPTILGDVVAALSFGFWVGLLGPRYDATIWRATAYLVFLEHGKRMARKRVHGRFNALRRFRNRIAHHEPIFLNNLQATHAEIIEAISWMCPTTAAWAMHHSRFPSVFAQP